MVQADSFGVWFEESHQVFDHMATFRTTAWACDASRQRYKTPLNLSVQCLFDATAAVQYLAVLQGRLAGIRRRASSMNQLEDL